MDFGKAFSYTFDDPDWIKKIVIMGLISIIPILGQLVLAGWMIDIIKKIIQDEPVVLPDLDFGGQLSRGFGITVVSLVYSLPIILVAILQGVITSVASNLSNGNMNNQGILGAILVIVSICFVVLYILYALAMVFILPMAYGRYAEYGKIGEALKLGAIFNLIKKSF